MISSENKKKSSRNISLQIIRIVAMLMIVTDHLFFYVDFPQKSVIVQITNSGVFIFLFISGYLFGEKEIDNWKNWFVKRLLRICIPVWIFMIIDLIIEQLLLHNFSVKYIFIYLFNIQGFFEGTQGGIPLWFITLILICYLITPLLKKIKRVKITKITLSLIVLAIIIIQILVAYITDWGMVYGHKLSWCIIAIAVYAVGFLIGNGIVEKCTSAVGLTILTIVMATSSIATIFINKRMDRTWLYNDVIVWYGILIVDLWIISIIYKLGSLSWTNRCLLLIDYLDGISYEFYIVHYLIIKTITLPLGSKIGSIRYILLTIVLSIISGTILHYICKPIIGVLKAKLIKE